MQSVPYLTQRRGIFFIRRWLTELSTELSPMLVCLGTTDRRLAFELCVRLTAQMDRMTELPPKLGHVISYDLQSADLRREGDQRCRNGGSRRLSSRRRSRWKL